MEDLPPEGAGEEELAKAAELCAAVEKALEDLGYPRSTLPEWYRHFFLRATLVRFLRGRSGDVEQAKDLMLKAFGWFHETGYWDNMVKKFEWEDPVEAKRTILKYSCDGVVGVDKRGAPVNYLRIGLVDTGGLIREVSWDVYVRSQVYGLEAVADAHYKACLKAGVAFMGYLTVIDIAGSSFGRSRPTVEFLIFMSTQILEDHFPESSSAMLIVNVPWYFNWVWKVVSPILPARTVGKIRICGTGFLSTLEELVDRSQIPAFLGGDSTEPWPGGEGGEVPDKAGKGLPPPARLHIKSKEQLEFVAQPGKLLVWEFRVLAYDLGYAVDADGQALHEPRRVRSDEGWQAGQYAAQEAPVKVTVSFDNSFSMFREKDIEYRTFEEEIPIGYEAGDEPPEEASSPS